MEFKFTKSVIEYLDDAPTHSDSLERLNKSLLDKVSKELFSGEEKSWKCLSIALDLLQSTQTLIRHCRGCFPILDEAGVLELLSVSDEILFPKFQDVQFYIDDVVPKCRNCSLWKLQLRYFGRTLSISMLQKIIRSLTNDGFESDIQVFIECCMETAVAIADSEPSAKSRVISTLLIHILEMLEHPALVFKLRMEVLKSVNILLEQCPVQTKETTLEDRKMHEKITTLVEMVMGIGDYEFQVCIFECLMRLFPRKARQKYASTFIQDTNMMEEFLMIRDKVFETDCRIFLNNVNARNEDPTKGVYSFPCTTASIGCKKLRKPEDANYEEFWVDFNIGSMRITIFCEQENELSQGTQMDEGLWETLEICRSNIRKYSICIDKGSVVLVINLKNTISQIYPSQHSSEQGDCITIEFTMDLEDYVSHAVHQTFNFEKQKKSKVSTVQFPLQICIKDQDHDNNSKESDETNVNHGSNSCEQNSQNSISSSIKKKRKISVPRVPMKPVSVPVVIHNEVKKSKGHVDENNNRTPKTPVKSTRTKVKIKTPVVEVSESVKRCKSSKYGKVQEKQVTRKKSKTEDESPQKDIIIKESQTSEDNDLNGTSNDRESEAHDDNILSQKDEPTDEKDTEKKGSDEVLDRGVHSITEQNKDKVSTNEKERKHDKRDQRSVRENSLLRSYNETFLQQYQEMIKNTKCLSSKKDNEVLENKDDSFGFDTLNEIDRVPESLEVKTAEKTQEIETEVIESSKAITSENTTNESNNTVVNADDVKKTKGKISSKQKKEQKYKTAKPPKKNFTDVDNSLKELCDIDDKENKKVNSESFNTRTNNKNEIIEDRRPLSQEEVDHIYTFRDPEENIHVLPHQTGKKKSKTEQINPVEVSLKKKKGQDVSKADKKKTCAGTDSDICHEKRTSRKVESKNFIGNFDSSKSGVSKSKNARDDTCSSKSGRNLRSRKNVPNYSEVSESEANASVISDGLADAYLKEQHNDAVNDIKNKVLEKSKSDYKENKRSKVEKYKDNSNNVSVKSNPIKGIISEGRIVTTNSDESDAGEVLDESTNIHEEQRDASDLNEEVDSRKEKYEESLVESSLYVESDDSCNARNYRINYKDKKRSSIKLRKNLEHNKTSDFKSSNNALLEQNMQRSKVQRKSVSFDDSVLKDISPIQKQCKVSIKNEIADKREKNTEENKKANTKKKTEENKCKSKNKDNLMSRRFTHVGVQSPVHVSYSKSDSNTSQWSKIQKSSRDKPGVGYDPFDFDDQTDNTSNRSERLDRLDVSKELNEKHSRKFSQEDVKKNNKKSGNKIASKLESHVSSKTEIQNGNCSSLMVQDQVTKKWHRSSEYRHKANSGTGTKVRKRTSTDQWQENTEVMDSLSSPVGSVEDKPLQEKCQSDDDLHIESNNAFEKILQNMASRRHAPEPTDYFQSISEDPSQENLNCISPIQTPYLSSASTPKIASGKKKQYTPLNVSVVKTPQSATPGIDNVLLMESQSDDALLSDNEKSIDNSAHISEKSWIKSKIKSKKPKKTPVTYKQKRKVKPQRYSVDEQDSQPNISSDEDEENTGLYIEDPHPASEVRMKESRKQCSYFENLKPCFLRLEDIRLMKEDNEDETAKVKDSVLKMKSQQMTQNLDDLILTPYTPVKLEHLNQESDIDAIQTEDDYLVTLSDQDDSSFNLHDSKYRKQTVLGDSGFHSDLIEDLADEEEDSISSGESDTTSLIPKKLFKYGSPVQDKRTEDQDRRSYTDISEETSSNFGFNTGLPSFLNSFGIDITRQMERKKEQVEAFTKQAVKELHKHHNQNWVVQHQYRSNVDVEFKTKMMLELEALERDIDLLKEAGQKTAEVYKYQIDVLHKNRDRQMNSLQNMRDLQSYLKEKSKKVCKHNRDLQNDLRNVLKKDVMTLQKRLMEQTQKDELANIKRSLQRTFSTSMLW